MCMQCMAGAMAAGSAATGARSYLATRTWAWLTPRRLRRATVGLMSTGLVASALLMTGSSVAGQPASAAAGSAATRNAAGTSPSIVAGAGAAAAHSERSRP